MSAERAHAVLSASGAHRWLHCPPSARLEEQLPDTVSDYAKEGTVAHGLAEVRLRKQYVAGIGPKKYEKMVAAIKADPHYKPEMDRHVETYYDAVADAVHSYACPTTVLIEQRLDFSDIVPDGFGTGDCLVIGGDTMHVIDFKYGQGVPVSPVENPQMMLYALGALRRFSLLYDIRRVVLTIVQPRNQSEPGSWETTADALRAWSKEVKPIAQAAHEGRGEYAAGTWCRFCRARGSCRARAEQMLEMEAPAAQPKELLGNAEIGALIGRARELSRWANDLEEYALGQCLAGEDIPGYKAVEGVRRRVFTDTDAAFAQLREAGYDESLLYVRKPIGFGELDKLVKKEDREAILAPYIELSPGKPALVPASDRRPAYTNRPTVEEAFKTPPPEAQAAS